MSTIEILPSYVAQFLIVLLRTSIFLIMMPLFGSKNVPSQFKIGFAVAAALVLAPVIRVDITAMALPLLVLREIVVGFALGLIARSVFIVVEMAGEIMSNSMGLAIATSFNPEFGQSTEVSQLYGILTMLLFLSTDAHHDLIYVFIRSYELMPPDRVSVGAVLPFIVSVGAKMFIIVVKISMPVLLVMIISNILLGFLSKAAPQLNVFFVGFPMYVFVGLIVMIIGFPVFTHIVVQYIGTMKDDLMKAIVAIGT